MLLDETEERERERERKGNRVRNARVSSRDIKVILGWHGDNKNRRDLQKTRYFFCDTLIALVKSHIYVHEILSHFASA